MNTYKITNLTNTAGKRDFKFNSSLDIEYVDNMIKKTAIVKPGASLYLTVPSLPMSIHKLRAKNLISVVEVSAKELADSMNNAKPKLAPVVVKEEVTSEENSRKSSKKKKE
jgi:hypothetical protein